MTRFGKTATVTSAAWVLIVATLCYAHSAAVLRGPRDGDTYVYNWSFQLFAFGFAVLPWLALILGVILAIEWVLLRKPRSG
jgi:hypothetical protein